MGRTADIQPRWLVSLMCQWVRRIESERDGALGYPAKAAFLTIGVARNDRTDPTEYSAKDYRDLEEALTELREDQFGQWASMMMYYRPWVVDAFKQEGWAFGNSIYYARLHAGHRKIATKLDSMKEKPLAA